MYKDEELQKAYEWCIVLHEYTGRNRTEADCFWNKLKNNEGLLDEFVFYMNNRQFLGEYSIEGMTIIDVIIWQMDHFKSEMDRGKYDMQSNPDVMILSAFETMINMEDNPRKYLNQYMQDTGTDYPGKY